MMKRLLLPLLLAVPLHLAAAEDHIRIAGRDVALWKPAGPVPEQGHPVIVFSHGFGGCNTQSVFLMEALAQAGYFVLAPNHKDARCGSAGKGDGWYPGKAFAGRRPEEPFRDPKAWSDTTYKDREADVEAVLDAVLHDKTFQGITVDSQRVGLAGHSLGGYTVLGLAGAWPSWRDRRVKAVLALSPYCEPYISNGDLGHLNVPVMYQGGTRDFGVTPTVKRENGAYDRSSAPKYYVEFDGAGHFAWTNLNKKFQDSIDAYSVAFFDRYLNQKSPDPFVPLLDGSQAKNVSVVKGIPSR
jgi:predicted dienelactone hydrolase